MQFNIMEFKIRELNTNDWETLKKWWDWWPKWQAPPKDLLPLDGTGGFILEKGLVPVVAGFVYLTNSNTAILEWLVSNPEYREDDRGEAIDTFIVRTEEILKQMGFKYMFSIVQHKRLIETHKKLGWSADAKPSYELIKTL